MLVILIKQTTVPVAGWLHQWRRNCDGIVAMNETEAALAAALGQTGFPFEHHIFEEVRRHGWTTIPNRLYVDAEEDKAREMDLLCYRAESGSQGVTVYTALLISCKARTEKPWVMMTRPWPSQRPSWFPYPPIPVWTNSPAVLHESRRAGWGLEYFNLAACTGLQGWSEDSREEVFAIQEFEAARDGKGKQAQPPKFKSLGDASLYTGVMSLLKALAYELAAVGERRARDKEKLVYHFNLLQLLDGELYEASFAHGGPEVKPVQRYRYFARTMLAGKEHSARIDFCTKAAFPALLQDMGKLHRFNVLHFNELSRRFNEGLLLDQERLDALLPLLEPRITSNFSIWLPKLVKPMPGWVEVVYEASEETLRVKLDSLAVSTRELEASPYFVQGVERAVRDVYGFSGKVIVEDDIPF
jgi:hypothetical protein